MSTKVRLLFGLLFATSLALVVTADDSSEEVICDEPDSESESVKSGANDVIVVQCVCYILIAF